MLTGIFASGAVSIGIAIALLLSSVWLWAAIWRSLRWLRRAKRATTQFRAKVWGQKGNFLEAADRIQERGACAPAEAGFVAGIRELEDSSTEEPISEIIWRVERRMLSVAQVSFERVRRDVALMGIIAATAPLAGLLGTVMGIVSSFLSLAESGGGDIAAVAPGLAEALGTTGLGLIVAIPAVIAGQYIRSGVGRLEREYRSFKDEMMIVVRRSLNAG